MNFIKEEYFSNWDLTPKEILGWAAEKCTEIGSSTAVIVVLSPDGHMNTTNLGDSGYMILRPDPIAK